MSYSLEIEGLVAHKQRLEAEVDRLETENLQLKQACGYPIPADKETINNPFKCGTCDARALENSGFNSRDGGRPLQEKILDLLLSSSCFGLQRPGYTTSICHKLPCACARSISDTLTNWLVQQYEVLSDPPGRQEPGKNRPCG